MNEVGQDAIRVMADAMHDLVGGIARKAGMPEGKADFLADMLVQNDLRGVFSHGSRQIATYAVLMRDGLINPDPQPAAVSDSPATIVVDGDGGLGYFAAAMGAESLIAKSRSLGIAAAVTRNHGHIGAAGIYARQIAEQGLIAYVTSGHQLHLNPEQSIMRAAGGSPMAFAVPSGETVPMALDFGTMHDLYADSPHVPELFSLAPGLVFRSMGLGFMCQALGGFLAGVPLDEKEAARRYRGANQGSLIIALDIAAFMSPDAFKRQMDAYMEQTGRMQPMPGYDRATLPGVLEAEREQTWRQEGIPVDSGHRAALAKAAGQFGISMPF